MARTSKDFPAPNFDVELVEKDGKHFYDITTDGGTSRYGGTTGWLKWIGGNKTNILCNWYGRKIGDAWMWCLRNLFKGKNKTIRITREGILDFDKKNKGAAMREFKKAGAMGTDLHNYWEKIAWGDKIDYTKIPKYLINAVSEFEEWFKKTGWVTHATEIAIGSPEFGFGGMVDWVGMDKDGTLTMADWKSTKSGIHEEYAIQVGGAYMQALSETYSLNPDRVVIVRCPVIEAEVYTKEVDSKRFQDCFDAFRYSKGIGTLMQESFYK